MNYTLLSPQELVQACTTMGNRSAWAEFVRRFQPLIAAVVERTARRNVQVSAPLVDDLVQETYLRLCEDECKWLRAFVSRHDEAIFGFLKVVAATVTLDYFRMHNARKRGNAVLVAVDINRSATESCTQGHHALEDAVLMKELEDILSEIVENGRDRAVFWLHYRSGFTAKAISEIPAVELSVKGVESCLKRLKQLLQEATARPGNKAKPKRDSAVIDVLRGIGEDRKIKT
jgi:RNA polymerase sigma-70 factor (ECF subfamily)